jgi:glycosyltransferase involved in cell wall biosynthesis
VKLSGVVIAQDEERDLPACLSSLAFCDEVVVVDGGSRDRTVELARAAGAKVVEHAWPGYGAQRAFALGQAQGDHVLFVDADERVDTELAKSIQAAVASSAGSAGGEVLVKNFLYGHQLRFGGCGGDWHLRLVRRSAARVREAEIHEGLEVDGPVVRLAGALEHHSYQDLTDYLGKSNEYTSLLAKQRLERGDRFSPLGAALRLPWGFGKRYILQLGFLDGWPGFAHAALSAYYDFLKVAKLKDLQLPPAGP